jgi:hypothetical protein
VKYDYTCLPNSCFAILRNFLIFLRSFIICILIKLHMHVVWHDLGLYLHSNIFVLSLLLRLLRSLLKGKLQNCITNSPRLCVRLPAYQDPITAEGIVGRDGAVGIATRYGLDGPGIEYRWGMRFSAPVQNGPVGQPTSYTTGAGPLPCKAVGSWRWPPTTI